MAKGFPFKINTLLDDIRTALKSSHHLETTASIPNAGHLNTKKSYSAELSRDPARPENISFNADYQHTHQTALGIEIKPHNQSGRGPDGNNTPPHEDTPTDGDPVSLLNGEELLAIEDGTLPGLPAFTWRRFYRSTAAGINGPLGHGWTHSLAHTLTFHGDTVEWRDDEHRTTVFPLPDESAPHILNLTGRASLSLARVNGLPLRDGYALSRGNGLEYIFIRDGDTARLSVIQDRYGNLLHVGYDPSGRLASLSNSAGWRLAFVYASATAPLISEVRRQFNLNNGEGWQTEHILARYSYSDSDSDSGQLISVRNVSDETEHYRYRLDNVITSRQLAGGAEFHWEWEDAGGQVRCTRQYGNFAQLDTRYAYDSAARRVTLTRADGSQQTHEHNEAGLQTLEVSASGAQKRWRYNDAGLCTAFTNGESETTRYFYSDTGELALVTLPDGQSVRYTWLNGAVVRKQQGHGRDAQVWQYRRNAGGDITEAITPEGLRTRWQYSPQGCITQVILPDGDVRRFRYDALGRCESETRRSGTRQYTYHGSCVHPATVQDEYGSLTRYEYDAAGRLLSLTHPDGTAAHWRYNAWGKVTRHQDEAGRVTHYDYDAPLHLLTRKRLPDGTSLQYRYDNVHLQVSEIINQKGESHRLRYQADGLLREEIRFDGVKTQWSYDRAGRLKEKREYGNDHSAPPWVTAYDYAPGGHLVCTTLPDGETLHRRYDACGRMTEAGDDTSSLTWQYDRFGRLTAEYQERVTTRYRYDELGRLSGVMQPDGQWQQFSYDAGRLTQLHLGGTLLARWQYDGKTRLSAWQQGNGLLHQYRYDSRGRRTLHRQTLHDAVRRTQAFQYSPDGRLTDISGDDPRRYHYDDAGRLLQAELPHQRPEGQPEEGFTWDTTGNRVRHPHQAQQDVTGNRLLKYVGTRMTFDRFGRLTEQHGFRGVTRHHYDCRHRLVRSELPDGQQVTYTYDVLNRRTSKTAHGETRYFFWHGTRLSGEMLSGRRDYRGYIYHPGSWTPLAQTHHHALMQTPQVWWYGTDTTGAPVELTDTAGETVWRAQRLAWGNLTDEAWLAEGADNCLRLPGQYEDRETGLFYNLHRYYDPRHGRYITPDPLGLAAGLNGYAYADGDPISKVDPLGLFDLDSDGLETYYRTMSQEHYQFLIENDELLPTSETFISPTQSFSEGYSGVLVMFKLSPGTTKSLESIGVRDHSRVTRMYADMPYIEDVKKQEGLWKDKYAYFKGEDRQINIGLGTGRALDIFNINIKLFSTIQTVNK